MSIRNIRKIYGDNSLPPPEGNSDEEYEPLYAKDSPSKYKYHGLVLSSHSESEHESTDAIAMEQADPEESSKKKKKKKKKQRRSKQQIPRSSSLENIEMDEIDKSLMEVNAILGAPPEPTVSAPEKPKIDPVVQLLGVNHKHLNVSNELRRMFGPEGVDQPRRRGRQQQLNRFLKKAVIVPITDNLVNFQKIGLSMSVLRREDNCIYFTFDHNRDYQRVHRAFMNSFRSNNLGVPIEEGRRNMYVEGLLESADSMFRVEEYSAASTLIEQAVACMQYVAHPSFNLTDPRIRLEYKIMENRPFHIALLKHLHLLTNRACHRTALELAKLLLILDPSDPLAVLFIIDTLALRARDHQWLIDAVDYWSKERDAGFLFNIQYSYAMAHFHVATKQKADLSHADQLLQNAMMRFPSVVMKIFECASVSPSTRLQSHVLFNTNAEETTAKNLKDLIFLYSKFIWSKWREPAVFDWLTRNAHELADKYDGDTEMQNRAKEYENERLNLFQGWPDEVVRHLTVIKPMANLLVDGAVPRVTRGRAFDPVPPADSVNRYSYEIASASNTAVGNSALYELFFSILPDLEIERQWIDRHREALFWADLPEDGNNGEVEPGAVAEDEDTLTEEGEDDDSETGEARAEPDELVLSVGVLTDAVRRIMDIYETGSAPRGLDAEHEPARDDQPPHDD